jgi:hypothetical protein
VNACPTTAPRQFEYPLVTLFLLGFMNYFYLNDEWKFVRFGVIPVDKIGVERFQIANLTDSTNFGDPL